MHRKSLPTTDGPLCYADSSWTTSRNCIAHRSMDVSSRIYGVPELPVDHVENHCFKPTRDFESAAFLSVARHVVGTWLPRSFSTFFHALAQIATNNIIPDDGTYPLIRWHQTADYGYAPNKAMPNTFMAVALDLPDDDSPYGAVHIRDKQDVGLRLAMASLNTVYGLNFSASGPVVQSVVQTDQGHVMLSYPIGEKMVARERKNFEASCVFSSQA